MKRWQVGTFNGCEYLILSVNEHGFVALATGPTPWGTGMILGIPKSQITNVRDMCAGDSWRCSGSFDRWTAANLVRSFYESGKQANCNLADELSVIVSALGIKPWVRPTEPGWWMAVSCPAR